jgi:hypothetical protein
VKLLTAEILKALPPLGTYSDLGSRSPTYWGEALAVVKYFHPVGGWTWYATEYDPEAGRFFGLVDGLEAEFGYWTLADLEGIEVIGLGVERDLYWTPVPVGQLLDECQARKVAVDA